MLFPVGACWAVAWIFATAFALASVPVFISVTSLVWHTFTRAGAGIPVVVGSALLLKAIAAASVYVPVEAISALASKAAAFACICVFVDEPVEATLAFFLFAFASAVSGVPVLSYFAGASWSTQAFAAFVVPVMVSGAVAGVCADALA